MAELGGDAIEHLEDILSTIQDNIRSITDSVGVAQEMLQGLRAAQAHEISMEDVASLEINPKLSDASRFAIETSEGPLEPERLKKFLMEDAFGKPKPNVLPIARQYTPLVEGLIVQLLRVKNWNNEAHNRYMSEKRNLDTNLNKRIDTLVGNLKRELEKEAAERRTQTSMDSYVVRGGR